MRNQAPNTHENKRNFCPPVQNTGMPTPPTSVARQSTQSTTGLKRQEKDALRLKSLLGKGRTKTLNVRESESKREGEKERELSFLK